MTDIDKTISEAFSASLPYESWERLAGESSLAFSAFCAFRDFGAERNVRKAVEASLVSVEKDKSKLEKRYRVWRNWCTQFRWKERAADYDLYLEKLKAAEIRKTIEAQGEKHRQVTEKMLDKASMKLDIMRPEELTQSGVIEFVTTGIKWQREIAGLTSVINKTEMKQGELSFVQDFQGL